MHDLMKKTIVILFLILLLGAAVTPEALAWGPPGKDGWYLGPDGRWYQGMPRWTMDYGYGYPEHWGSQPGYDRLYECYQTPVYPCPAPEPYVQVALPPPCPPGPYYSWEQPAIPDRYHMHWGTFGTYDNWAREFHRQHGRSPNEQDISDFWYSQQYAAQHCGRPPW